MDTAYGLRLGIPSHRHHHHRVLSPESHVVSRQDRQPEHHHQQDDTDAPLRFSVVNILRPEFGRKAILSTKTQPKTQPSNGHTNIPVQIPRHSPLSLPRDLSLSSTRLSPQSPQSTSSYATHRERDTFSSHCGLTSPLQRHNGLSRSGSLESLASSRSSVASSSVTGPPSSLCSTSSAIGGDSLNGDSTAGSTAGAATTTQQTGTNGQSLWPAWVYCTRYSDRPSSGTFLFLCLLALVVAWRMYFRHTRNYSRETFRQTEKMSAALATTDDAAYGLRLRAKRKSIFAVL